MVTRERQDQALGHCVEAFDRFVATAESTRGEDWTLREGHHPWSLGDTVEHVTISISNIARRLETISSRPLNGEKPGVVDFEIPYLFYRGDEPPNVATPTGAYHADRGAALAGFCKAADAFEQLVQATQLDLRLYGAPHPWFGVLDGVQWILFAGAHAERHRAQVIGQLSRAGGSPTR